MLAERMAENLVCRWAAVTVERTDVYWAVS